MERRPEHESQDDLGRGRLRLRESLTDLWRAVTSPSPAADWVRYRLLAMLLSVAVLAWSLGCVAGQLLTKPTVDPAGPSATGGDAMDDVSAGETTTGQNAASDRLRTDLFKIPRASKPAPPPEPKTNPVELLALIELQGVLGGARPRAMIQYKRTGEAVTVSVGDDLGEFQVLEIRERSVVLKWREELFELSL